MFEMFRKWLESPCAKKTPPRQAKQHARQVRAVMSACNPQGFKLSCLFDKVSIRDCWLTEFEKIRKAGTVKSYCHSLRFFYRFLDSDKPMEAKTFFPKLSEMVIVMDGWISVYRKLAKGHKWKKDMEQLEQLLTSADFLKLDNSEYQKKCKFISNGHSKTKLKMLEFTRARDYLLMQMCIDNASRTGALANMTLGEFGNAKYTGESYVISVFNHKTVGARGPADIVLTPSLFKEANIYSLNFCNELEGVGLKKENPFFISYSGKKMSSSMVTAQLNSYWSKAVDHTETRPRFHATLVRKSAVTKTHNVRPNLENDLANLMCHSRKMQNQTYLLEDKRKNAVATSQQLRNILRESEQPVNSSGISLERVKMNWKTFIVQYNGCLQRKLRMVKLQSLW